MTDIEQMAEVIFYADPPSNPHGPNSDLVFDEPYTRAASDRARRIAQALSDAGFVFAGYEYQNHVVDIDTLQGSELGKIRYPFEKDARDAAQKWVGFCHEHFGGTGELIMLVQRRLKGTEEWTEIARYGDLVKEGA